MDTEAEDTASLAALLHAERVARSLSVQDLLKRLQLGSRFKPRRADAFAALCRAARIEPQDAVPTVAAPTFARLVRKALPGASPTTGPALLVRESRPFEPDLADLHDQMMLRLLVGLGSTGMTVWILRTPQSHVRPLAWLLKRLPARPATIVSVGRLRPACLALLRDLAPMVRLGVRSLSTRQVPCVEHDARLEAWAIAAYAAEHEIDQIGFLADLADPAGIRRVEAEDLALLSELTGAAHNRHIDVPANLTFWIEASASLASCGVLPALARHLRSSDLLIVAGAARAAEVVATLASPDGPRVVCRHWSAAGTPSVPVIGRDLDQLALAVVARVLSCDSLPAEAAVLVPPTWHRRP
jgi:hypothetical protein